MKYNNWLSEWLEFYVKPSVKTRTYDKYKTMVRLHIAPNLGEYPLENLTASTLQRYIVTLSKTMSSSYVNSVITVIQSSLKMAVTMGVSDTQSADKVKRPKVYEKQTECFTVAEQQKIENAVLEDGEPKMFGIVLCLYTGIRIGELLSLQWNDIDLTKGILTVRRSCHYGKNDAGKYSMIIDTPKTNNSQRVIPLPKQILPYLNKMKRRCKSEYVITYNGNPVETRAYQYRFANLLKKLKIPPRGFHSLRHTFATRAIECGMDVKTLSEILGHKNPTITLNRYTHSLMEHKTEMMNKLGKNFPLK